MGAIRNLIRRYPVAAIAVVVAAAGFGGWTIYQSHPAQPQGAQVLPPPPARPGIPAVPPSPGTAVTPTAPLGAAPGVTPTSPLRPGPGSGGATPGQGGPTQSAASGTTGEGRANPFEPLAGSSGSNPAPGGGVTIPPVPPLPPTTPGGPAQPAVPPAPEYRVVGFLWSDVAFAILEDGQSSYIVSPGDTVKPGIRVVSIDVRREIVRLSRDGTPVDLTLSGLRRSP